VSLPACHALRHPSKGNPLEVLPKHLSDGLTELPANSAEAFENWYRSRRSGGHPWEIHRGGSTTHIDLGVIDRHEGWSVFLDGSSTARMAETIRIALALLKANQVARY